MWKAIARPVLLVVIYVSLGVAGKLRYVRQDLVLSERGQSVDGLITERVPHAHGLVLYKFLVNGEWFTGSWSGGSWPNERVTVTYDRANPAVNVLDFYPSRARDTLAATAVYGAIFAALAEAVLRWRGRRVKKGL